MFLMGNRRIVLLTFVVSLASVCSTLYISRQCGVETGKSAEGKIRKRIIGGELSEQGEWPWLVSLQVDKLPFDSRSGPKQEGQRRGQLMASTHVCGATLIADNIVISAAHCFVNDVVEGLRTQSMSEPIWTATVGEHELNKDDEEEHMIIEQVIVHPGFDSETMENDIAVIKLRKPVRRSRYVREICLAPADLEIPEGTLCSVAGWGHTEINGTISDQTRHVYIPILDSQACSWQYDVFRQMGMTTATMSNNKICAGQHGKDSCQFDSGGPLSCEVNGRWYLTGIVSYGIACGFGFPALYTNVAAYNSWLNEALRQLL